MNDSGTPADAAKARVIHRRNLDEVHDCTAPGCEARARVAYLAEEEGPFADRWLRPGDWIDLCPPHDRDLRCAQDARCRDDLAEWLRPSWREPVPDPSEWEYDDWDRLQETIAQWRSSWDGIEGAGDWTP